MKTTLNIATARLVLAGAMALGCATALAQTQTQSWNYKSYLRDRTTGQYNKEKFVTSTIKLTESDGKAVFRMVTSGRGDPCISASDLPAEVTRSAEITTITVTPTLSGCEPFRYEIKNDGSGGIRLNRRNDRWVANGFDHDLTPAK
jgi:hypothetical protein